MSTGSKVITVPGQEKIINSGLVVKSIGYKGVNVDPSLPFDEKTGTIANDHGRVLGLPGVYCSGWIGRGAVGVIADTLANATFVAKEVYEDLSKKPSDDKSSQDMAQHRSALLDELSRKKVDWPGWLRIDESERKLAEHLMGTDHKPREKITEVDRMIEIAHHEKSK